MSEEYYLTKDGITFEEMTLEEIGREVLSHDKREFKVTAEYHLSIRAQNRPWQSLAYHYTISSDEIDLHIERSEDHPDVWELIHHQIDMHCEAEKFLVEKVGQDFVDGGWSSDVPDCWQAYDKDGYQEELKWRKEKDARLIE